MCLHTLLGQLIIHVTDTLSVDKRQGIYLVTHSHLRGFSVGLVLCAGDFSVGLVLCAAHLSNASAWLL